MYVSHRLPGGARAAGPTSRCFATAAPVASYPRRRLRTRARSYRRWWSPGPGRALAVRPARAAKPASEPHL
ncbi:MAG: hypothetical protein WKG07_36115 [Hymenobacter sp.]